MAIEVSTATLAGRPTAVGAAGTFTLVVDRPAADGGGGLGFSGGQLLYLSIAACVSNDLFREAPGRGVALERVEVRVRGDFIGEPAVSGEISYQVTIAGDAAPGALRELVEYVDSIAEIPNTLRAGTAVRLGPVTVLD
jgi:uncharacterized OsmC-like protein